MSMSWANQENRRSRWISRWLMFLGPLALVLAVMPVLRAVDVLLPDLVSDWGEYDEYSSGIDDARVRPVEEITYKGTDMLVVRFDGFVTNIGDGPLRVAGNPQTDSVYQWLLEDGGDPLNPADYQPGPKVSVIYETDDGHNHWHLKNAQEYALWNQDKTEQVTVGAKVGFCLYDIGQIWANAGTRYYDGSVVQFCDQGDPSSTTIEMGVTPGWKDVYGYTLNQQWVDVSAVAPGIYYLSNQTDTSNQILESDETNNGISFHPDPVTIPGYVATDTSASTAEGVAVDVSLPSDTYGSPGSVGYELTTEPANGTVTVDAAGTATYTPDPGFWGDDGFEFAVFDTTSSYPTVRPTATVAITITNSNTAPDVTAPGTQSWTEGDPVNLTIAATDDDGDALIYTATGLPDGLDIPTGTNTITGTPTTPANGTATINVTDGDDTTQINFNWTVEPIAPPSSGGGSGGGSGGRLGWRLGWRLRWRLGWRLRWRLGWRLRWRLRWRRRRGRWLRPGSGSSLADRARVRRCTHRPSLLRRDHVACDRRDHERLWTDELLPRRLDDTGTAGLVPRPHLRPPGLRDRLVRRRQRLGPRGRHQRLGVSRDHDRLRTRRLLSGSVGHPSRVGFVPGARDVLNTNELDAAIRSPTTTARSTSQRSVCCGIRV